MYCFCYSVPSGMTAVPEWRDAAVRASLRRIEFSCPPNSSLEEATAQIPDILSLADRIEVRSVHIPFGGNGWDMTSGDDALRAECAERIASFLRACAPLHSPNYTFHGDAECNAPDRKLAIRHLRDGITRLLPILQEQKASLNIELLPRTCIGRTPEELEEIAAGFPAENVGFCIDVNHLNNHPEAVPGLIRRLGDRIRTFHFSDYDGVDECHWLPPHGSLDWAAVMHEIRSLRQDAALIFESWEALKLPAWQKARPLSAVRIRGFEKAAAVLEAAEQINWKISF